MLRRTFLKTAAAATAATALSRSDLLAATTAPTPKIALGLDNFSVRALGWKAPELITYAASLRCDTLFISDLDAYASFDAAALRAVRRQADAAGLALYVGGWSICPTSKAFKKNWGTAEELLRLGIRVAQSLATTSQTYTGIKLLYQTA
jgi:hypothetical protein